MSEMTKCRYAKRYKGTREPSCGCDYCQMVWEREEMRRAIMAYVSDDDVQNHRRQEALDELAEQAQELDMGY